MTMRAAAFTSGSAAGTFAAPPPIGSTTPNSGAFTNITASGTLDVEGHSAFGSSGTIAATTVILVAETFANFATASIGINASATNTRSTAGADATTLRGILSGLTVTPSAGASFTGIIRALSGIMSVTGAGDVTKATAITAQAASTLSGTLGTAVGIEVVAGTGTPTNEVGIMVANQTVGATANVNLLLGTLTPVAGNWNQYNASTYDNYFAGHIQLVDAKNIITGTTTGSSFGNAITQKTSVYGVTPIAQRAGAAQAAVATTAATAVTPFGYTTGAQADAIVTLVNELRAWAVAWGAIKGAA